MYLVYPQLPPVLQKAQVIKKGAWKDEYLQSKWKGTEFYGPGIVCASDCVTEQ